MELVCKQFYSMKILLIFRFFYYVWFIDSENLRFVPTLKEKTTITILKEEKVLTFNIANFPNLEISAPL